MTFVAPTAPQGDMVKPADLNGHLLIITPIAMREGITTSLGEADAIAVDLVDLTDGVEYHDVLFFNKALVSTLNNNIGNQVLARMGQGIAKPGKSAPWILLDATQDANDVKLATDYIIKQAEGILAAPTPAPATPAPQATAPLDVNDPKVQALLAQLAGQ